MISAFNIKTIDDVEITHKKVFLRTDFNVLSSKDPTKVKDTLRIHKTIPTINKLLEQNNQLIIGSHLSKTNERTPQKSLKAVFNFLQNELPDVQMEFFEYIDDPAIKTSQAKIIFLENLRFYPDEKKNDVEFAKRLASLAEVYVDEAFGNMHREHASMCAITQFLPSYAGLLVQQEIESIYKAIHEPEKPLTILIGGAKISTKVSLIESLLDKADTILVGGAMAHTFFVAKGWNVGKSYIESEYIAVSQRLLDETSAHKCQLKIPIDVLVKRNGEIEHVYSDEVIDEDIISDIGTKTIEEYTKIISESHTLVWNGPVGITEDENFLHGTDSLYACIKNEFEGTSIVGGGDTLAYLKEKDTTGITHVSTGGGAMLAFIEKGTLPAIESLRVSQSSLDRNS